MFSFSERLRISRQKKGYSQQALADIVGVKSGKQTLSRWENGLSEPNVSELLKLTEALDTTVGWLVEGTESSIDNLIKEAPPGYVLLPIQEVFDMQRLLLKQQVENIESVKLLT